jgi:hypothetical protein
MDFRRRPSELDRFQRRHPALAVPVAVVRKFGEDGGGSLAALFPVIGEQPQGRSLRGSGVALVVGALGALWAGFGVILASEEALDRIWGVPRRERAGFVACWTALQLVGGWFLAHEVRNATPVYGTFALVIGLLVWVQLGATLTVIAPS